MSRAYCRACGDILDTDPVAGNAMPGATYCEDCIVTVQATDLLDDTDQPAGDQLDGEAQ